MHYLVVLALALVFVVHSVVKTFVPMAQMDIKPLTKNTFIHFHYTDQSRRRTRSTPRSHRFVFTTLPPPPKEASKEILDTVGKFHKAVMIELDDLQHFMDDLFDHTHDESTQPPVQPLRPQSA